MAMVKEAGALPAKKRIVPTKKAPIAPKSVGTQFVTGAAKGGGPKFNASKVGTNAATGAVNKAGPKYSPKGIAASAVSGAAKGATGSKTKSLAINAVLGGAMGGMATPTAGTKSGSGSSYSPSGYASGRTGGSTSGPVGSTSSQVSAPSGPVGSSNPTLANVGTIGGTPSSVAQMALSTLTGGGRANNFGRMRNRRGAGYNVSLSPEQLRNLATRRMAR